MNQFQSRYSLIFRAFASMTIVVFMVCGVVPLSSAQMALILPAPGVMVDTSPFYEPAIIKGITIHPDNPLKFDFIIDQGQNPLTDEAEQKREFTKLIKYFLVSLTVPEDELWVNLSPYEKDRMIPDGFAKTEMGRDLLAQDYILKQLTASLIYPESELGKKFWDKVYKEAQAKYGTTDIPVNTFNKVWIVPDEAQIYESGNSAYLLKSHLKVMLESDYIALDHNNASDVLGTDELAQQQVKDVNDVSSAIVREIVIPAIEQEVNEGKNFAQLRQINNSLIIAAWFKVALKESLLGKVYVDKNKVVGVGYNSSVIASAAGAKQSQTSTDEIASSPTAPRNDNDIEKIYAQYLDAFKKGVYNFIKEDVDPATQEVIPRKYFSGGYGLRGQDNSTLSQRVSRIKAGDNPGIDNAMMTESRRLADQNRTVNVAAAFETPAKKSPDAAMLTPESPNNERTFWFLGGKLVSSNKREDLYILTSFMSYRERTKGTIDQWFSLVDLVEAKSKQRLRTMSLDKVRNALERLVEDNVLEVEGSAYVLPKTNAAIQGSAVSGDYIYHRKFSFFRSEQLRSLPAEQNQWVLLDRGPQRFIEQTKYNKTLERLRNFQRDKPSSSTYVFASLLQGIQSGDLILLTDRNREFLAEAQIDLNDPDVLAVVADVLTYDVLPGGVERAEASVRNISPVVITRQQVEDGLAQPDAAMLDEGDLGQIRSDARMKLVELDTYLKGGIGGGVLNRFDQIRTEQDVLDFHDFLNKTLGAIALNTKNFLEIRAAVDFSLVQLSDAFNALGSDAAMLTVETFNEARQISAKAVDYFYWMREGGILNQVPRIVDPTGQLGAEPTLEKLMNFLSQPSAANYVVSFHYAGPSRIDRVTERDLDDEAREENPNVEEAIRDWQNNILSIFAESVRSIDTIYLHPLDAQGWDLPDNRPTREAIDMTGAFVTALESLKGLKDQGIDLSIIKTIPDTFGIAREITVGILGPQNLIAESNSALRIRDLSRAKDLLERAHEQLLGIDKDLEARAGDGALKESSGLANSFLFARENVKFEMERVEQLLGQLKSQPEVLIRAALREVKPSNQALRNQIRAVNGRQISVNRYKTTKLVEDENLMNIDATALLSSEYPWTYGMRIRLTNLDAVGQSSAQDVIVSLVDSKGQRFRGMWNKNDVSRNEMFTFRGLHVGEYTIEVSFETDAAMLTPEIMEARGEKTILVVDDDGSILRATSRFLKAQGFTIVTAANGREALDAVRAGIPGLQLVLSDFNMPQMNGEDLAKELHRSNPQLPFIIESGSDLNLAELQQSAPNIRNLLAKPVGSDDLMEALLKELPDSAMLSGLILDIKSNLQVAIKGFKTTNDSSADNELVKAYRTGSRILLDNARNILRRDDIRSSLSARRLLDMLSVSDEELGKLDISQLLAIVDQITEDLSWIEKIDMIAPKGQRIFELQKGDVTIEYDSDRELGPQKIVLKNENGVFRVEGANANTSWVSDEEGIFTITQKHTDNRFIFTVIAFEDTVEVMSFDIESSLRVTHLAPAPDFAMLTNDRAVRTMAMGAGFKNVRREYLSKSLAGEVLLARGFVFDPQGGEMYLGYARPGVMREKMYEQLFVNRAGQVAAHFTKDPMTEGVEMVISGDSALAERLIEMDLAPTPFVSPEAGAYDRSDIDSAMLVPGSRLLSPVEAQEVTLGALGLKAGSIEVSNQANGERVLVEAGDFLVGRQNGLIQIFELPAGAERKYQAFFASARDLQGLVEMDKKLFFEPVVNKPKPEVVRGPEMEGISSDELRQVLNDPSRAERFSDLSRPSESRKFLRDLRDLLHGVNFNLNNPEETAAFKSKVKGILAGYIDSGKLKRIRIPYYGLHENDLYLLGDNLAIVKQKPRQRIIEFRSGFAFDPVLEVKGAQNDFVTVYRDSAMLSSQGQERLRRLWAPAVVAGVAGLVAVVTMSNDDSAPTFYNLEAIQAATSTVRDTNTTAQELSGISDLTVADLSRYPSNLEIQNVRQFQFHVGIKPFLFISPGKGDKIIALDNVITGLIYNPNTPAEALEKLMGLFKSMKPSYLDMIYSHPNLPLKYVREGLAHSDPNVRQWAIRNPRLTFNDVGTFVTSSNRLDRESVLLRSDIPLEVILQLLNDPDSSVSHRAMARSEITFSDFAESLLKDVSSGGGWSTQLFTFTFWYDAGPGQFLINVFSKAREEGLSTTLDSELIDRLKKAESQLRDAVKGGKSWLNKIPVTGDLNVDLQNLIKAAEQQAAAPDAAMLGVVQKQSVGGIDLNPSNVNLKIKKDGNGVMLPLEEQPFKDIDIPGFEPVIINVTPLTSLPFMIGKEEDDAAAVLASTS